MRLSPQTRLDLAKITTITIAYVLFSCFLAVYDHVMLDPLLQGRWPEDYSFRTNLALHTVAGLVAGTLGGYTMVLLNKTIFRRNSLGIALLKGAGAFLLVYAAVTVAVSMVVGFAFAGGLPTGEVFAAAIKNATSPTQWIFLIIWGTIALLTLFLLQVYDKFGPGVLRKFLLGKYFHPREESRVFMFLDMRSSTTIAEQIGTAAYFALLRDCYALMTKPIVENRGEITQYIGDEVVISWQTSVGLTDARFLRCFFEIQRTILEAAPTFRDQYGLTPEFKAGIHAGPVIAGEIGEIKKDIVYSGDVLNATARIQDLCNNYRVDLLASSEALSQLETHDTFNCERIGLIELRGKEERIELFAVRADISTSLA